MTRIIGRTGPMDDPWHGWVPRDPANAHPGAGLLIDTGTDPEALAALLDATPLVVIGVPGFADGRGFSLAAALRAMGYRGHLRARGPLLVDQLRAALRSGFDDVEIDEAHAARTPDALWRSAATGADMRDRLFGRREA